MGTAQLEYVENRQDILVSFLNFNEDCEQYPELTRSLLRATSFWVYNPDTNAFAPSKFTGFKNMNFPNYIAARKGLYLGNNFNGHLTRKAIGSILGIYRPDDKLSAQLKRWGDALDPGILDGIDETKWKFIPLCRANGPAM